MLAKDHGLPSRAITQLREIFETYPAIQSVILYGSRAKGNFRAGSDIDLCIQGPDFTLTELLKLENQLDELLLPWKIDVSLWHQLSHENLKDHITRVGKPLYIRGQ